MLALLGSDGALAPHWRAFLCALTVLILTACEPVTVTQNAGSESPESPPPPPPPVDPGTDNSPPVVNATPSQQAKVGEQYSYIPNATDADGDALTFEIVNRPEWATFDEATGSLVGTPRDGDVGTSDEIQITVMDGTDSVTVGPFRISVAPRDVEPPPQNTPPTISGTPDTSVLAGQSYSFRPSAADVDGDTLRFSITNKPGWARFSTSTGRLSGTPTFGNVGRFTGIRISVSDANATTSLPAFEIDVQRPTNRVPTIAGHPGQSVVAGNAYSFQPSASDPDDDSLTFAIENKPAWATFNASTGRLSGTPAAADVGTTDGIVISVSDGSASAALAPFSVRVRAAAATNHQPVISGSPARSVVVGTGYSFRPAASDPDGDALTFDVQNKPDWATFSTTTGQLSGTPPAVGAFPNIVISVSDGTDAASLPPFRITVQAVPEPENNPPLIAGTPPTTVQVGVAYSFQPTASDPDGDALSFSIQNKPSWASFNTLTGRLAGTSANIGSFPNIVIRVSDGAASASLPAFTIQVLDSSSQENLPPTISGSPTTSGVVGTAYSFQPTASDPDGDALTFSILNRPSWASFNTTTGRLSGTPAARDVGSFSGIVVTVSDGMLRTSLPSFAISVADASTGTATVSWTAPTRNTDGSTLTNLAGYRIFYGTSRNSLDRSVQVSNPGLTTFVVEDLSAATWYFGLRAYNSAGAESSLSNLGSKTIR